MTTKGADRSHSSHVEAAIGAADQWTDYLFVQKGSRYTVSVWGTFQATVHVQRRLRGDSTVVADTLSPRTIDTFTVPDELDGTAAEDQEIRIGVPAGAYTSGTANVRIGK